MTSYTKCNKNSNNDVQYDLHYTFESCSVVFIFFFSWTSFAVFEKMLVLVLTWTCSLNFLSWPRSCGLWFWTENFWMMTSYNNCNKYSNNDVYFDVDYTFESRSVVFIFFLHLNKSSSSCTNCGIDLHLVMKGGLDYFFFALAMVF